MKALVKAAAAAGILLLPQALADEKYDHFPSLDAPDVATALCNLQNYNEKLSAITKQKELDAADMVKVHELTYTLENALARLKTTIEEAAVALEEVHLASESMDASVIDQSGKSYLTATTALLSKDSCKAD